MSPKPCFWTNDLFHFRLKNESGNIIQDNEGMNPSMGQPLTGKGAIAKTMLDVILMECVICLYCIIYKKPVSIKKLVILF